MRLFFASEEAHKQAVETLVADLVPRCRTGFGACKTWGVLDEHGRLVAGWVWNNWDPDAGTMEFSGASVTPKWMTRRILHRLFAYAFEDADCQMILTRNSAVNERLHDQLFAFGFDRFDIPRLFGREEDGVVWSLTDDQWRASRFYIDEQTQITRAA